VKDVEDEVQELLEEIGHKMMLPAVRTVALLIRMSIRHVLRGVYVNTGGVERVRIGE
jgi:glycerone phosphate O-acyltransferase